MNIDDETVKKKNRQSALADAEDALTALKDYLPKVREAILVDRLFEVLGLWRVAFRGKADSTPTLELHEIDKNIAAFWAAESITQVNLLEGQSRKETLRCPGAIAVSSNTWQILLELNRLKSACATAFHNLNDRPTKREFSRNNPKLVQLQATRLLDLIEPDDEFDSLRFFVFADNNCTRKLVGNLKDEWLEQLRALKNNPSLSLKDLHAHHYDKNTAEWQIKKDILDISPLHNNEVIAERRTKALHIRAYVSKLKGQGRYITTSTPIVVRSDCARLEIINELSNQVGSDDTDFFEELPIVARKNLYRYKAEFRPSSLNEGKNGTPKSSTKKIIGNI